MEKETKENRLGASYMPGRGGIATLGELALRLGGVSACGCGRGSSDATLGSCWDDSCVPVELGLARLGLVANLGWPFGWPGKEGIIGCCASSRTGAKPKTKRACWRIA